MAITNDEALALLGAKRSDVNGAINGIGSYRTNKEEWKSDVASAPADASPSTSFASHKDLQGPWATMVMGVGKDTATQLWPRLLQAKSFTKTTVPTTFLPELNRLCSLPTADELIAAIAQL